MWRSFGSATWYRTTASKRHRAAACLLALDPLEYVRADVSPVPAEYDARDVPGARLLPHPPHWDVEQFGNLTGVEETISHAASSCFRAALPENAKATTTNPGGPPARRFCP
jgi:hypothetical protein